MAKTPKERPFLGIEDEAAKPINATMSERLMYSIAISAKRAADALAAIADRMPPNAL